MIRFEDPLRPMLGSPCAGRGVGEIRLVGGLTAPVSRTRGPVLKEAGWV